MDLLAEVVGILLREVRPVWAEAIAIGSVAALAGGGFGLSCADIALLLSGNGISICGYAN